MELLWNAFQEVLIHNHKPVIIFKQTSDHKNAFMTIKIWKGSQYHAIYISCAQRYVIK